MSPLPASFLSCCVAIVAWRLYALHGGQAWIRRVLWIAVVLYVSSSTAIITVSLVPIVGASCFAVCGSHGALMLLSYRGPQTVPPSVCQLRQYHPPLNLGCVSDLKQIPSYLWVAWLPRCAMYEFSLMDGVLTYLCNSR